jgi:predicted nucleotidyltransferase
MAPILCQPNHTVLILMKNITISVLKKKKKVTKFEFKRRRHFVVRFGGDFNTKSQLVVFSKWKITIYSTTRTALKGFMTREISLPICKYVFKTLREKVLSCLLNITKS